MKCQRCSKAATLHITEVTGENSFDELHLCEDCAQKYLYEAQAKGPEGKGGSSSAQEEELAALNQKQCDHCGLKFLDFRNSGRLGCPHDYEVFREELKPLLENIHGDVKHAGKMPRRAPRARQVRAELAQLRKQLQQAVTRENYEEAARLRDRIKQLEQAE
jgi:protein arginine kinase activator